MGMPPLAGKEAVLHFFRDKAGKHFDVAQLVIIKDRAGKSLGEALVEMSSYDQYEQALRDCQRTVMGNKKVEIEEATSQDINNAANFHGAESIPGSGGRGRQSGGHRSPPRGIRDRERTPPRSDKYSHKSRDDGCILLMKGLPFDATTGDIEEFFEGYRIKEIEPVVPAKGQKNKGEAYVEMGSARDCASAIREKNKNYIGDRYIELFAATRADMHAATR